MAYLQKTLANGHVIGITNGEIVLPVSTVLDLDDQTLISLMRELAVDCEFLKDYFGSGELDSMTLEQAKIYVLALQQRNRSLGVKRSLIYQRRQEFNSRQAQLMLALINRDGYICQHPDCTCQEDLTIDHIVPLSRGGSDELENLQLLCRRHNSKKGTNNSYD